MIVGLVGLCLCGCRDRGTNGRPASTPSADAPADAPGDLPRVVFMGTSLTAGLGLDPDSAFPALVARKIDSAGLHYSVVNAGESGESSAGALHRVGWILRQQPAVLVLETGANDGLRGQDPDSTRANVQALIDYVRATSPGTRIVLVGMEAEPNLGAGYVGRFRGIFPGLAQTNRLPLIPFLLQGVGGVDSLNQQDGIHPNPAGARIVADNVWTVLRPLLRDLEAATRRAP